MTEPIPAGRWWGDHLGETRWGLEAARLTVDPMYTFHIRRGAKWSDGTTVTAQDFEWTYRRLLSPSTSTQAR